MVGYMLLHFSKAVRKFLQLPNITVRCSVSVNKGAGYVMEIALTYTPRELQRAIERVKKVVATEEKDV